MITKLDHGYTIDTWYDRQTRSWVSQLKDPRGNQVVDAQYDGQKSNIESSIALLKLTYQHHLGKGQRENAK